MNFEKNLDYYDSVVKMSSIIIIIECLSILLFHCFGISTDTWLFECNIYIENVYTIFWPHSTIIFLPTGSRLIQQPSQCLYFFSALEQHFDMIISLICKK